MCNTVIHITYIAHTECKLIPIGISAVIYWFIYSLSPFFRILLVAIGAERYLDYVTQCCVCCNCNNRKLKFGKFGKLSKFVLFCSYSPSPVGGAANPLESIPPASLSGEYMDKRDIKLFTWFCCMYLLFVLDFGPTKAPQILRLTCIREQTCCEPIVERSGTNFLIVPLTEGLPLRAAAWPAWIALHLLAE